MNPPPLTLRACFVCTHMQINDRADMVCAAADVNVRVTSNLVLCAEARAPSGPCGIEARYLTLKGENQ